MTQSWLGVLKWITFMVWLLVSITSNSYYRECQTIIEEQDRALQLFSGILDEKSVGELNAEESVKYSTKLAVAKAYADNVHGRRMEMENSTFGAPFYSFLSQALLFVLFLAVFMESRERKRVERENTDIPVARPTDKESP